MNQILKPSIDKDDSIECEYCKNKVYYIYHIGGTYVKDLTVYYSQIVK